jgi:hypothetical protein
MLAALAERRRTSIDAVLTRELEDVACPHAELAAAVPALSGDHVVGSGVRVRRLSW